LRFILRHCGVRKVRLIPKYLRALPEPAPAKAWGAFYEACPELAEGPSYLASFSTFYDVINYDKGAYPMKMKGKVWKYGDDIDTDVIYPGKYLVSFDAAEAAKHALEGLEKDFYKKISKGDILVVGKNFGSGSSREQAAVALRSAGISAVVAESFARSFYRNAINVCLPVVELPQVQSFTDEGDELEIDLDQGLVRNLTKKQDYHVPPLPPFIMNILRVGGAVAYYKQKAQLTGDTSP
jgi:3-isopropylmalate/(R)-2-methylmalate dehydratase small subunit